MAWYSYYSLEWVYNSTTFILIIPKALNVERAVEVNVVGRLLSHILERQNVTFFAMAKIYNTSIFSTSKKCKKCMHQFCSSHSGNMSKAQHHMTQAETITKSNNTTQMLDERDANINICANTCYPVLPSYRLSNKYWQLFCFHLFENFVIKNSYIFLSLKIGKCIYVIFILVE